MIKEKIQSFLKSAGEYACYALCLIKTAEQETGEHIDIVVALESGIERGFIKFNWDDYSDPDNFYLEYADKFLSMLTETVWKLRHLDGEYKPKGNEKVIYRWERKTSGGRISHFRLPEWDSLEKSKTVAEGKIVSTRLFIKIGEGGGYV